MDRLETRLATKKDGLCYVHIAKYCIQTPERKRTEKLALLSELACIPDTVTIVVWIARGSDAERWKRRAQMRSLWGQRIG